MPGLGLSYGRGGATTAQWDIANSDCVVIQGSNMAENHPIAFRFVMEARERGAKVIHIDPRFTRTSANADIYAPIRPGTDIAFLGGLIHYALENERYFKDYVVNFTNATTIINDEFKDTEDLEGIFSGFDEKSHEYQTDTWSYKDEEPPPSARNKKARTGETFAERASRTSKSPPPRDETMQDPRCVFQILKRHYARYTPEFVEEVCGTPKDVFLQVAETICANSGRDRTTSFCYAVGWTHHTVGVQLIRTCAILQLLLGNVGRPGGGVLALRGHAAIQGSTDTPTLYNLLPGYLPKPLEDEATLQKYMEEYTSVGGWWHNFPKYIVSLLKAWYADKATGANEWGYQWLPKLHPDTDYSYYPIMWKMNDGQIKGLFVLGENFAVGGPGAISEREGLRKLKWFVNRDPFLVETSQFWQMDGVDPATVETECFAMPACWAGEKDGSLTNTQRLLQWHDKAVDGPGDSRSENWFMYHLGTRLRKLYAGSTLERDTGFPPERVSSGDHERRRDEPLLNMTWDYPVEGPHDEPIVMNILKEINGYTVADGRNVKGFTELKDDGTTACGNWIYSGVMPEDGKNMAASRERDTEGEYTNHCKWGFAWPANRRILYNRCSADPDGQPWSERKRLIWWDASANGGKGEWTGHDVPDFEKTKAPDAKVNEKGEGMELLSGSDPFIMHADGRGWLYVPHGLKDGPLPAHYEPFESPIENPLYPRYKSNPAMVVFERPDNPYNNPPRHGPPNPEYPYILTTYRVTEHHTTGAMSRWNSWLSELQPELFVEISPQLAAEKGIQNLDWVTLRTARTAIEGKALVTDRMQPMRIQGRTVHVIGIPYHWGPSGLVVGDIANDLLGVAIDPNVRIHESKALTCAMEKGRHSTDSAHGDNAKFVAKAEQGGAVGRVHSEGAEMQHRTPLSHG